MTSLELVRRPIEELKFWEENPRRTNRDGFEGLRESVREWGVVDGATCSIQPVVLNVHPDCPDVVVGGERRVRASSDEGFDAVWCREVELSPDEMAELAVRLNVPAGDWDWEMLVPYGGAKLLDWGFRDLEFPAISASPDIELDLGSDTGPAVREAENYVADVALGAPDEAGAYEAPGPGPGDQTGLAPEVREGEPETARQVMLFYLADAHREFNELLDKVRPRYDAGNQSDLVLAALRELVAITSEEAEEEAA